MIHTVQPYARLIKFEEFSDNLSDDPISPFSLKHGIALLRKIEWCGRISHRSEEKMTKDSWERFIDANVRGHGDWSIVEHASATVDMTVDRGITHEIVRHRLFSFTQESTRFVNYEKKNVHGEPVNPAKFIVPFTIMGLGESQKVLALDAWECAAHQSVDSYKSMVAGGIPPQIARSVLINSLASRIAITGNLRVWRHMFIMRTTVETHPQCREIVIPLLQEFKEKIPILFDDVIPLSRQKDNLHLPR